MSEKESVIARAIHVCRMLMIIGRVEALSFIRRRGSVNTPVDPETTEQWRRELGDLSGVEVIRVSFDQWVRIELDDYDALHYEVSLSGPFEVTVGDVTTTFDGPTTDGAALGLLISSLGRVADDAWIDGSGAFHLNLRGWGAITARPSEEWEAFDLVVQDKGRYISMPGGEIAIFD